MVADKWSLENSHLSGYYVELTLASSIVFKDNEGQFHITGHVRQRWQWGLPGGVAASPSGDQQLCQRACASPLSHPDSSGRPVWQCRSACRSAQRWWTRGECAWEGLSPLARACREDAF